MSDFGVLTLTLSASRYLLTFHSGRLSYLESFKDDDRENVISDFTGKYYSISKTCSTLEWSFPAKQKKKC